ncbi:MAG: phosphoribosyl-AMP cyclohydrolase [Planctomycetota bacterium]
MTDQPTPNFNAGILFEATGERLLPVITQDHASGRVLMMAWMNRAAWDETLQTGRAVYFSRSRGQVWRKGDTSGHRQHVSEVRIDCDADCILLRVEQVGAACHQGYQSCFFRRVDSGQTLIDVPRLVDPVDVYGG